MSPLGTVYIVVFSLVNMRDGFEKCVNEVVEQLQGIFLFAAGAPIILVGTRKDQVGEGPIRHDATSPTMQTTRMCLPREHGGRPSMAGGRGPY